MWTALTLGLAIHLAHSGQPALAPRLALQLAEPGGGEPACEGGPARSHPLALYREGAYLAAYHLSATLRLICPSADAAAGWSLLSALSLAALDDVGRAARQLRALADQPGEQGARAGVALAWLYLRQADGAALETALGRLPAEATARLRTLAELGSDAAFAERTRALPPALAVPALAAHGELLAARRTTRPWLAGLLSAVVPGAGQLHAGAWGSAAAVFAVNALLIGASAELFHRRLYLTGATAATVASMVYLGGIINAADLARRRNDAAARPARDRLDRLLVPEAHP